jgi:hypothetical protein
MVAIIVVFGKQLTARKITCLNEKALLKKGFNCEAIKLLFL